MPYYSQLGQDKWLIENLFNRKRNGFFVECGCSDCKKISNTYTLETEFGWDGIGIDILQNEIDKYNANRKAKGVCAVLSDVDGKSVEVICRGMVTGIYDETSISYVVQNKLNPQIQSQFLNTTTLSTVLNSFSIPDKIDLLLVDVEGHEVNYPSLKGGASKNRNRARP